MSEVQPAEDATKLSGPASSAQDALEAEPTLRAASQPSGDAPAQPSEVNSEPEVVKEEPAPESLSNHMEGSKAAPEPQAKPDLPSDSASSESQPKADQSADKFSSEPASDAPAVSSPESTLASGKPAADSEPPKSSPSSSAETVPESEPAVKPEAPAPTAAPSPAAAAMPEPDVPAPEAVPSPAPEAVPSPAPAVAPSPAAAAAPSPAAAAAPTDSGQDDSGCDTEPEPERQSSAPASMAEPTGPQMADVEQLARSVVTDTLEKAKQEASIQRKLENQQKDPDTDDDGWLDVVGNGQLKKKVITAGSGGRSDRPKRSQLVTVHLSARFEDGQPAAGLPERLTFGLGDGEVITGLDMTLGLMQPGETAEVYMDARFAYGEKGLDDDIPPNTNLTFTVQLENVQPELKYDEMSAEERLTIGSQKRDRGNWWFKRDDFNHAIQCYRRALDFFDNESDEFTGLPDDVHVLFEERLKVHNNMAAAQMKLEAYDAALRSVELVLTCQPNNVKALYRKGRILMAQSQVSDAVETLRQALKHSPDNRTVQVELNKALGVQRKQAEEQKGMYRKMLGLPPAEDAPAPANATKSFPVKLIIAGVACALAAVAVSRLKLF